MSVVNCNKLHQCYYFPVHLESTLGRHVTYTVETGRNQTIFSDQPLGCGFLENQLGQSEVATWFVVLNVKIIETLKMAEAEHWTKHETLLTHQDLCTCPKGTPMKLTVTIIYSEHQEVCKMHQLLHLPPPPRDKKFRYQKWHLWGKGMKSFLRSIKQMLFR